MPPRAAFTSETAMATPVVAWLRDLGWDVYQEVQVESGDRIADIVATKGPKTWIVECKQRLSFELLEQALRWDGYSHLISVAVPMRANRPRRLFEESRLGLILATNPAEATEAVSATPRYPDQVLHGNLRDALQPEMKTYAPAGSRGRRWTPYTATAKRLREYVEANPGIPLRRAVQDVEHHYTSDKAAVHSIDRLVSKRRVPGVCSRFEHSDLRLFPTEAS